jgi:ribosome recycling factor
MINDTLAAAEKRMQATVDGLRKDLSTIRTGRASSALVDHLKIDYVGTIMPLNQLAGISTPEAKLILIQPWDKSSIPLIEKAIRTSELGLNPLNDGNVIRLVIPPLSEERRHDLIKMVHKRVEERKIILRNLRRDSLTDIKGQEKNKEFSQDESHHAQERLQKITDKFILDTDNVGQAKEAELTEI